MTEWKKSKDRIKYLSRKYLGFDPGLRKVKVGADFSDQKNILSGTDVKIVFDVGANVGQTTQKYRKLFPMAEIYGFEPYLESFLQYEKKFEGNALIHPINLALSDLNGYAAFFVNNNHYTNSFYQIDKDSEHMKTLKTVRQIDVKTETIDKFCHTNKIEKIDILKLDVQGGELLALKGAIEMLKKQAIELIYCEVEYVALYENQPLFQDIKKFLTAERYKFYKEYNTEYDSRMAPISGDAIFIKQKMRI